MLKHIKFHCMKMPRLSLENNENNEEVVIGGAEEQANYWDMEVNIKNEYEDNEFSSQNYMDIENSDEKFDLTLTTEEYWPDKLETDKLQENFHPKVEPKIEMPEYNENSEAYGNVQIKQEIDFDDDGAPIEAGNNEIKVEPFYEENYDPLEFHSNIAAVDDQDIENDSNQGLIDFMPNTKLLFYTLKSLFFTV